MATLRQMGVLETKVRMVEGTYEKTKCRNRKYQRNSCIGEGTSIGLKQGSALILVLFIGDKVDKQENEYKGYSLQVNVCRQQRGRPSRPDGRHGLVVNLEKMAVLWVCILIVMA